MTVFNKVLIANRGEIACRIIRTLNAMGIESVAVYSDADRHAMHVRLADEAVRLGPPPPAESYLNVEAIIAACRKTGAQAVHPGYGFVSESAVFATRLEAEGITFIGPTPDQIRTFGLKHTARAAAEASGVPLLPGTGLLASTEEAVAAASRVGYPVMVKSTAGGGGIGLQLCENAEDLPGIFEKVARFAEANFGDGGVYLEKFVASARHVEVQIVGDGHGNVVALGERDCSLQRRNQKVVEETPAPGLRPSVREDLIEAAIKLGKSLSYRSAGTVEFILDAATQDFYFLEVNTRLQVEHPVTEQVTGADLVEWMVRIAAGGFDLPQLTPQGASIEVRVYAENPGKDFQPCAGRLTEVSFPDNVRVDGWIETGTIIPTHYDPMIAKVIATGATRNEAISKLVKALAETRLYGTETNLDYLHQIVASDMFREGRVATSVLGEFAFRPATVDVLRGGTATAIQDWPGRLGYWDVGVPPSGPMDMLSHRLANRLVGNADDAAALEITMMGPSLRFNCDALVALTGAPFTATLDGEPFPQWTTVGIKKGQTLDIGKATSGARGVLAVRNGFDAPLYLGSRATFDLGGFGGHATGNVKTGAVLRLNRDSACTAPIPQMAPLPIGNEWTIGVLYGPHGAPDFFTENDIETLMSEPYEVHFNSARTGVRLIGPKPEWARPDGGEAGLHPSNLHDNAYAVGAIDFTGDMPIILGPDGPSLGGFACPAVVAKAEMWKTGQLRPGDKVRFRRITLAEAEALEAGQEGFIAGIGQGDTPLPQLPAKSSSAEPAILARDEAGEVPVCYRRVGEDYILIEFGVMELDLTLRARAHVLHQRLMDEKLDAIIDIVPGIRSLMVHFDNRQLHSSTLLAMLRDMAGALPPLEDLRIPSRTVHLPLSWDDEEARKAALKYMELVRADAPWCPWNIEFIRRINGLDDVEEVKRIVFDADYVVLGLGDVYLGAPVATPADPRHRLVTTKYNPARTWTAENSVGIGGAYMCIYGMEGPGGYQLVGRTLQMWNAWRQTDVFTDGKPWLLRFFDRIKFYPVTHDELTEIREAFPYGEFTPKIEESVFDFAEYRTFLEANRGEIDSFTATRQQAFEEERLRWEEQGLNKVEDDPGPALAAAPLDLPDGTIAIEAPMPGSVWKVDVEKGQSVPSGFTVAILEAMKTETAVDVPAAGTIIEVLCKPGQVVSAGDPLIVFKSEAVA